MAAAYSKDLRERVVEAVESRACPVTRLRLASMLRSVRRSTGEPVSSTGSVSPDQIAAIGPRS